MNKIVVGKIIKINKNDLLVGFDGKIGKCHISEISDYLIRDLKNIFILYEYYDFIVISELPYNEYILSFKKIHPKFLKWHYEIIETPSSDINLRKKTLEKLKKCTFSSMD